METKQNNSYTARFRIDYGATHHNTRRTISAQRQISYPFNALNPRCLLICNEICTKNRWKLFSKS